MAFQFLGSLDLESLVRIVLQIRYTDLHRIIPNAGCDGFNIPVLVSEAHDFSKRIRHPPNPPPQARELHDLTMVDKKIHVDAEFPDIPVEDGRVCSLKHDPLHGQLSQYRLYDVRPPTLHILGNALGFDHHELYSRVDESLSQIYDL